MESFHHRLHQAMQQKHITQSDLCAKTGISRSTMSQYCSGAFRPKDSKGTGRQGGMAPWL